MMDDKYLYRLACREEAVEIHDLMEYVYQAVADKETFVCDDLSYVEAHIQEQGFVVVATEKRVSGNGLGGKTREKIVACLIVDFPMLSEHNLGRDISLPEEALCSAVHMDSAVVHPEHRGRGLQGKLLAFAELHAAKRIGMPLYLLATVSPFNPASFETLEKLGYCLICTKEKYGGLRRRIYCKYLLTPDVFFLPGGQEPLSADIFFIRGKECLYAYDVGANEESLRMLHKLKPSVVVLSHFHKDHTANMRNVEPMQLYVDKKTAEHFPMGMTVERQISIKDGVEMELVPVVCSHSKTALLVNVNHRVLLVGDALYATQIQGRMAYNTQQLKETIDCLAGIETELVIMSHDWQRIQAKERVLRELRDIYSKRVKGSPYIFPEQT